MQNSQISTPTQLNFLVTCIASAKNVLDIFLGYDTETLCTIPTFNFPRAAYAAVVLVKIHFIASQSEGNIFSIIDKEKLQAENYLQRLLESSQAVIQMRKLFNLVMQMLQFWFQRQCRTSDEEPMVLRQPDGTHYDNYRLAVGSSRGVEASSPTCKGRSDSGEFPLSTSEESVFSDTGAVLLKPQAEAADWAGSDFETLFDMDNGRLFETALGWLGALA
jgi:hypothetical protein